VKASSQLVAVVLALGCGLACESVTPSRIEYWKGSTKGPGKLTAAITKANLSPRLRAQAAVALAEIGMSDAAERAAATLPAPVRWEILKTLVPLLTARLADADPVRARNARDALFAWRRISPSDVVARIDAALVPALARDFRSSRPSEGRFGLAHMVRSIGHRTAPMLVSLLREGRGDYLAASQLLAEVGDGSEREEGGMILVGRARSVDQRGREHEADALWAAMGLLGGRSVTAFLSRELREGSHYQAIRAAHALQVGSFPEVVPLALALAARPGTNAVLRDELFQVVARAGGPVADRGLLDLIARHRDHAIRFHACHTALLVGQAAAIGPMLEALPVHRVYRKSELVERLVSQLVLVEPGVKTAVLRALHSRSPVARMVAVLALEVRAMPKVETRLGNAADVPALRRLARDRATVKGFPPGESVGSEALRVARLLGRSGVRKR
jgi:hypothetical protein